MNFISSLLGAIGKRKAYSDTYQGTWLPIGGDGRTIGNANLLEANREWVFIAVDKVATAMQGVRFKVMRYKRNGDDEELFTGPLVDFLESPSRTLTGKKFIYLNTVYKELTGNAFWERKFRKLEPMVPTKVSPSLTDGKLTGFRYSDGAQQRVLALDSVLHDRYPDPALPFWGASKLLKIARWVEVSSVASDLLNTFFKNGAVFGGFIETEEETETRIKLIKAGLANEHTGSSNFFKWAVLPKGSKASRSTANMAEMEMGATDDRYRDKILATFGVPKTLVGLTTEVNRASADASEYIFAKYTLKPIADDFVEFLNVNVAPLLDAKGECYFAYDDFVPQNMELAVKERESALGKHPYMTINEARASAGLPSIPGGDMLPDGAPQEAAAAPEIGAAEEDEEAPKKAVPGRIRAAVTRERAMDRLASKAVEIAIAVQDIDAIAHKAFVGRVDGYEKLVEGKVRDFNNRQERDVVQRLKQLTKSAKGVNRSDILDMDREVTVLVDFVSPLLKGLLLEQAIAEFTDQAFSGQLDQSAPSIGKIAGLAARRLAKGYNDTTAKLLALTLNEGIVAGDDITQLTDRVRRVYEFSDIVRAAAVARTETFYIANEGSREAYQQSGVVKSMRWYTSEDERVCQFCGPQDGKTIGLNDSFYPKGHVLEGAKGGALTLDYRSIDVPPLHTNCRCFIRPEKIELN